MTSFETATPVAAGLGVGRAWLSVVAGLLLFPILSACVTAPAASIATGPLVATGETCCRNVEQHPAWLIAVLDPVAPVVGRFAAGIEWRDGYLKSNEDAAQYLRANLRPLDIVLVASSGRLSNQALPGLFKHAAVYLGSEADLRRSGVWGDPAARAHAEDIRSGKGFIEADHKGVHLSTVELMLDADSLMILRPRLSAAESRKTLQFLLRSVGRPFDFHFDADRPGKVFCSELVAQAFPSLAVRKRAVYGRNLILPDEFARLATRSPGLIRPVAYVVSNADGWGLRPTRLLRDDLERYWAAQPARSSDR